MTATREWAFLANARVVLDQVAAVKEIWPSLACCFKSVRTTSIQPHLVRFAATIRNAGPVLAGTALVVITVVLVLATVAALFFLLWGEKLLLAVFSSISEYGCTWVTIESIEITSVSGSIMVPHTQRDHNGQNRREHNRQDVSRTTETAS